MGNAPERFQVLTEASVAEYEGVVGCPVLLQKLIQTLQCCGFEPLSSGPHDPQILWLRVSVVQNILYSRNALLLSLSAPPLTLLSSLLAHFRVQILGETTSEKSLLLKDNYSM